MFTVKLLLMVTACLSLSQPAYSQRIAELKPRPTKQHSPSRSTTGDIIGSRDDIACSPDSQPRVLTDYSGWFTSPNFGADYPNDANCRWLILSQSQVVHLNFDFLSTEEFYDEIRVYDGTTTSSPIITGFDGLWDPAPVGIRSSGSSMLVVFTSDDAVGAPGFNVSYTSEAYDFSDDPCYSFTRPVVLTDSNGTFKTNGFPDRYWNYANCQWLFESQEPGGIVEVTFDHFSTETGYDVVRLFDGNSASAPLINGFDGQYPNPIRPVRSTQKYLFMRFISDYTYVDHGFNGTYRSLPMPSTTPGPPLTTTTSSVPAGPCGSVLNQSPGDAVVAPNYDLMCHLNRNDTEHLDKRCYDLLQNIPGYGDADSLISQGGNFGCSFSTRDDFVGSDNACFDAYQWEAKLINCVTCTKLVVCIRFN